MSDSVANNLENRKKFVPAKIVKDKESSLQVILLYKPVRVRSYHSDEGYVTKEERVETKSGTPKRYITKCYFQPKPNPVSYSETVILTLGSSKKHYFETVLYQTKLVPSLWSETMTTRTYNDDNIYLTQHEAFVEKPDFHYISLEPQQVEAV